MKRFKTNDPFTNPVVERFPNDCVLIPPAPPISAPPVDEQLRVMVFPKLAVPWWLM